MLLSTVLLAAACSKGRPLTPAAADDRELVARQVSERAAPVHVEQTRITFRLMADGTYTHTFRQRYRVLDQQGVDNWAHSQAYWAPWHMKRPIITASVTNRDASGKETTLLLDPSAITEQTAYPDAPDMYSDARLLRAPLPSVAIGSVVEEEITLATHRPFLAKQQMHSVAVQTSVPQDSFELVVESPADLRVSFDVREAEVARTEEVKDGWRRTTFTGGPYGALEPPEPLLPTNTPFWPSIDFGTGDDWKPLAHSYASIVDEKLAGIDFSSTVQQVTSSSDSDAARISKLYQWIKTRIRYVGIEFGESSVIPHAPDETVARGYGDCKDQATLLIGLLRAAGLPAHAALLNAGQGQDINEKLPAFDVFNHMIVVVATEPPVWLDPTAEFVRPGSLPVGDQGRLALVATSDSVGLVRTPSADPAMNTYREEREVFLGNHGNARVVERSQATGFMESELRATFARPQRDVKKGLSEYAERMYYTKDVGKIRYDDAHALERPYEVEFAADDSSVGVTAILDASTEAREDVLWSWLPSVLTGSQGDQDRRGPLALPVPYDAELLWKIHAPPGFTASRLPEPTDIALGPARLTRTVTKTPSGAVEVKARFTTGKALYSASEVKQFRQALWKYRQTLIPHVYFNHEAKTLSEAGKPLAAARLAQRELERAPQDGFARMRVAWILAPYLMDAARREARRAAELAPQNATLQRELGSLLSQNAAGTDLGYGYDRVGALAAYRKAYQMAPEDLESRLRIAVVLEHDDHGKRYASRDLDEAIRIYDAIPEKELAEFSEGAFRHNALYALFWAKRHEELSQRLSKLGAQSIPADLAIMNAAALSGPEAAIAEAKRLSLTGKELADALEAASGTLALARRYDGAAMLVESAIASSADATRLQSRARVLRKLKKVDVAKLPTNTPAQVVTKLIAAALSDHDELAEVGRQLLSRRGFSSSGKSSALDEFEAMRAAVGTSSVSGEMTADIGVAGLELHSEGSDELGYRVRTKLDYGAGKRFNVYVVRERNGYRVRAFGDDLAELGAEALHAAKSGNAKAARRWLDWARDSFRAVGGEDPLRVAPFARLYSAGQGDVMLSAAALAATSVNGELAVPVLEKARAATDDPKRRQVLSHALALAYATLGRPEQQYEIARTLHEDLPESAIARDLTLGALWELGRYAEYQKRVLALLRGADKDERTELLARQVAVHEAQGQMRRARQLNDQLIKRGEADGTRLNNQAWLGLFVGAGERDLEHALRAAEMTRDATRLHTLACLYAELGRVDEARRTLTELWQKRESPEPADIDWFVVGRMAEHFGLREAARHAYAKVQRPSKPWPTSTYALARKRLKRLGT